MLAWLGLVRNHVVATDLRPVFNVFEYVLRIACSIIHEELLDASSFILVLDWLTRKKTDRSELVTNDKGLAIGAEFSIEGVVPHVAID